MIIDSHTHIFPEKIKQDRSLYFNNEPEFKLLYDSPKAGINNINDLIESMILSYLMIMGIVVGLTEILSLLNHPAFLSELIRSARSFTRSP